MAEACSKQKLEGNSNKCNENTMKLAEGDNLEEQINELIALQSIYANENMEICTHDDVCHGDLPGGILDIPIFPPEPFEVKLTKDMPGIRKLALSHVRGRGRKTNTKKDNDADTSASKTEKLYPIKRLPPITLTFAFPHDYPSTSPSNFTLACCWLEKKHLSKLCWKLDEIWKSSQGIAVVMNWVSFLQEETINFLNIKSPYDLGRVLVHVFTHPAEDPNKPVRDTKFKMTQRPFDPRGFQTFGTLDDLMPKVLDFNLESCEVCFEEKAGENFLRLVNCTVHLQCKECMRGWFEGKIEEGAVNDLRCPGYKCEQAVLPTEVKDIVSPELYQKYERLLLKTAFDMMTDVINCPRPFCQFPVVLEDNLGLCQKCQHAFCGRCQNAYHGTTPCRLKHELYSAICEEYKNCTQARKKELELHYGKNTIKRAIEEVKSNKWLESNSKQCPSCGTFIQKKDGCNKMTCSNCHTFFCWLCQAGLSRSNPYAHYQDQKSACSNRLFEGMEMPDGFDDMLDLMEAEDLWPDDDFLESDDDDEDVEFLVYDL